MDWSHSSIASFRETAWAKVQREGNGEMLLQFEKAFFLLCSPCPSRPLFSFCVLFCLFSPLPLVCSPLYYLPCFLSYPFSCSLFSPNHTCILSVFLAAVSVFPSQRCTGSAGARLAAGTEHSCPTLLAAFTDPTAVISAHGGYFTREARRTGMVDSRSQKVQHRIEDHSL